jgi:2-methylisocitrate lyase-like PEP mutase family enzyme
LATTLQKQLKSDEIIIAPGAYDGLSARLVERAGFSAVYASGGAIARSTGVPDIGLLSLTEVAERLAQMTAVIDSPLIADADTGFGNANNVARTVHVFEQAGVAALHIEDQTFPKRCGHLDNKGVIAQDEMVDKLRAACAARSNPATQIIARTDAIAVEGFDSALRRAEAYHKAGADIVFVEAPQSVEQIKLIGESLSCTLMINMFAGGKTPMVPIADLKNWGYRLVIIPSDTQRAAIYAMQQCLSVIREHGDSASCQDKMVSFQEREAIVGTDRYLNSPSSRI